MVRRSPEDLFIKSSGSLKKILLRSNRLRKNFIEDLKKDS